ncbi:TRAP transporter large permease [Chelatococcus sp. HY11]|nr:TRAP transporter large permease [Chelatococcus sp. HY11]MBX3542233.1 TRAP transporter large permease [Chelatococcus sp.]CAH1655176.1 C4-dicarboxylate ABC transporter permease [Hyphomicrobiales bacterium]CAH1695357.1 C4-dicarboxylate ABC transporter permease [Hyphomicrobiales bacterium]
MTAMVIAFAILLVLLFAGMPVGFAMMLVGFIGTAAVYNWNWTAAIALVGIEPYSQSSNYLFVTIPLFVLMGHFTFASGISREMFAAARAWCGHWRGGLPTATIGACAGFSAACGSSLATAGAIGTITIGEMRERGIHPGIATATVAAGGAMGSLIPPSISMILYGLIADQSIGRLLMAGIVPALMLIALFILTILIIAWFYPQRMPRMAKLPLRDRIHATRGVFGITMLTLLVLGGIYGGIFTPTEAAGIGALGAFIIVIYRGRGLRISVLNSALRSTLETTCMIFIILIGAHVLNVFLAATRGPAELAAWVETLGLSPYVFFALIIVMYIVLGTFLDALAMIVLTVPVLQPVLMNMGFDMVWFGVIAVLVMEMAIISPPVGMCVYVVKGVAKDVPLHVIYNGIWPFMGAMVILVAILTVFPQIALFLPNLMYN